MIPALLTMLVVERVSPSEKSVQGRSAAKEKRGYGTPSEGIFKKSPEEQGKDDHHEERLDDRPEKTKGSLFVPDLHVTRNKTVEQFPVFSRARGSLPAPTSSAGG